MFKQQNKPGKRESMIGLDFGSSQIKAAVVKREGESYVLSEYAVRKLPVVANRVGNEATFAAELTELLAALKTSERRACVTISCPSAMVCHTEFPRMPMDEIKSALKLNSARYLRRDFSNYYLDAVELTDGNGKDKGKKSAKMKILVGGATKEEVTWYRNVLQAAKLRPEAIELSAISVVSALQVGHPELCEKHAVLLVDIGARLTTINFVQCGQPVMTRIMHFGGQLICESVAQALTLKPAEAEEEVLRLSEPVEALVRTAIAPLAREIRSSIDFFERQHECPVEKLLACGGTALSARIMEFISTDVGMPIAAWNPIEKFETSHFNGDSGILLALAPSLAAAVGAAASRV